MASPSRSGSVVTCSASDFSAIFLSSSRIFFFVGEMTYFGLKFFLGSTPSCDFGRSRTCPMDALTTYLPSRYFAIVFTLVGDSTPPVRAWPLRSPRSRDRRDPPLATELTGPARELQRG